MIDKELYISLFCFHYFICIVEYISICLFILFFNCLLTFIAIVKVLCKTRKLKICPLCLWKIWFSSLFFGFRCLLNIYIFNFYAENYLFTSSLIVPHSKIVNMISKLMEESEILTCQNWTSLYFKAYNWNFKLFINHVINWFPHKIIN